MDPISLEGAAGQPEWPVAATSGGHRALARVAIGAGVVVIGALLGAAIARLSQEIPLNSDQSGSVLEGWAMGHGNLLLGGWTLPSDSFFTSKLPLLALLERFQGLTANVEYEAAGILGAGIVLAGAWLAVGRLRGSTRWVAILVTGALLTAQVLLIPGPGNPFPSGQMLPAGSDHGASLLLLLLAWLALQHPRGSRLWLVVTWVALVAASAGDPLAGVAGGGAIALVGAIDLAAGRRDGARWDALLVAIGVSSVAVAPAFWWGMRQVGGFTAAPVLGGGYGLPPLVSSLSHNLAVGGSALLTVFGADPVDQSSGLALVSSLLHLCGLALVLAVLAWLLRPRRWLGLDVVSRVLVAGVLVDAVAYLVGQQSTNLTSARYLVPLLGFGAVLAGREGVPRVLAFRPRLGAGVLLALSFAYIVVFAAGAITAQPAAAPLAAVTSWLSQQGASTGLATYWDADVVTVSTRGAIAARPIATTPDSVGPYLWHATVAWYDPSSNRATFVLLEEGDTSDRAAVEKVLGLPAVTQTVDGTTILVWTRNLLSSLDPP